MMSTTTGTGAEAASATPLTTGTGAGPLTPGAITAAVKTELNLIPKSELDARSTPHPEVSQIFFFQNYKKT